MNDEGVFTMKGKGNDGQGDVPERDLWETNQELFDILMGQYNFLWDCCASEDNKKVEDFSDNFLEWKRGDIRGIAWMNPPFSESKKMFKHFFEVLQSGVAIYRCDNMETKVWQEIILKNATWIFIPNKRIAYEGMEGKGSRFPSALIGFNVPVPKLQLGGVTLIK